jgi:hypothetical protein
VLPAAASARTNMTTLRFDTVATATVVYSATKQVVQEKDVSAGKVIGFDVLYVSRSSSVEPVCSATSTLDIKGGQMYGTFLHNLKTNTITDGKITGGTGAFVGARGTFKSKPLNKTFSKWSVTITYSR